MSYFRLRVLVNFHLKPLKREGKIHAWEDRDIEAGAEWAEAIKTNLEKADIVLLAYNGKPAHQHSMINGQNDWHSWPIRVLSCRSFHYANQRLDRRGV